MYKQFFGLTHAPLGKKTKVLWDNGRLQNLETNFNWLLQSPGIGLLTGESGTGKTAALRHITEKINPHQYKVIYQPDTDFTRYEIYCRLADNIGIEVSHRCSKLWHDIKAYMLDLVDSKKITPIWILDEAQNLPVDFLKNLPAFLNFAFDSRDIITVWLIGLPNLDTILKRPAYSSLTSRIQVHEHWMPVTSRENFAMLIDHAFKDAGCHQIILSDSAVALIYTATQGKIRIAHQILLNALRFATEKSINHLTDDLIEKSIAYLK
jgi:type II secretory pathway predicted ATPase ExeA